jgi:hypothetical protein
MGPPIVWLASDKAADVHDERIIATEFDHWLHDRKAAGCGGLTHGHSTRSRQKRATCARPVLHLVADSRGVTSRWSGRAEKEASS